MSTTTNRRRDLSRYHRFYRIVCRQRACVYCGLRAGTYDHFVPLSVVEVLAPVVDVIPGKVLLPACGDCNNIANRGTFPTVAAKRRFIQAKLRLKYKALLEMPVWNEQEVLALGHGPQDFVRAGMAKRRLILERLAWRNNSNSAPLALAKIRAPFLDKKS